MIKESYLNLIITIALSAMFFSFYVQNEMKSLFSGLAYGVCFGSVFYFLKRFKHFTSKNGQ